MKFLHICENKIITLFLFESNFHRVKTLNPFIKFRKYNVFDAVLHRVNPFSTVKCTNFSNNIFCSTVICIKYCLHSRTIASGNYWWEKLLLQNKSKKVLSFCPTRGTSVPCFISMAQKQARLDFRLCKKKIIKWNKNL